MFFRQDGALVANQFRDHPIDDLADQIDARVEQALNRALQREREIEARAAQARARFEYTLARRIGLAVATLFALALVWQTYRWQEGVIDSLWSVLAAAAAGLLATAAFMTLMRWQASNAGRVG